MPMQNTTKPHLFYRSYAKPRKTSAFYCFHVATLETHKKNNAFVCFHVAAIENPAKPMLLRCFHVAAIENTPKPLLFCCFHVAAIEKNKTNASVMPHMGVQFCDATNGRSVL